MYFLCKCNYCLSYGLISWFVMVNSVQQLSVADKFYLLHKLAQNSEMAITFVFALNSVLIPSMKKSTKKFQRKKNNNKNSYFIK